MATRVCQRCNGATNILVPNPVPPPKQLLIVCPKCNGTGEEEIRLCQPGVTGRTAPR